MTNDRLRSLFAKRLNEFFDAQNGPRDGNYRFAFEDQWVPGHVHPDDLLGDVAWLEAKEYISRAVRSLL